VPVPGVESAPNGLLPADDPGVVGAGVVGVVGTGVVGVVGAEQSNQTMWFFRSEPCEKGTATSTRAWKPWFAGVMPAKEGARDAHEIGSLPSNCDPDVRVALVR
jgi:hypothetical protein